MPNRAFCRFVNVKIPYFAKVEQAFVRFTAFSNQSGGTLTLRCGFVAADNPSAPLNYPELQALVIGDWVSWTITGGWTDGSVYDTPDLTAQLQAIFQRTGWYSGQAVLLIVEVVSSDDYREWSAFEYANASECARLYVQYWGREIEVFDNFDGDEINSRLWNVYTGSSTDGFYDFSINDNRLRLLTYEAWPDASNTAIYLESKFVLAIPFDVQVDIDLTETNVTAGTFLRILLLGHFTSAIPEASTNLNQGEYSGNYGLKMNLSKYSTTNPWELWGILRGDEGTQVTESPYNAPKNLVMRIVANDRYSISWYKGDILLGTSSWGGNPTPSDLNYCQFALGFFSGAGTPSSVEQKLYVDNFKVNVGQAIFFA